MASSTFCPKRRAAGAQETHVVHLLAICVDLFWRRALGPSAAGCFRLPVLRLTFACTAHRSKVNRCLHRMADRHYGWRTKAVHVCLATTAKPECVAAALAQCQLVLQCTPS